MLAGIPFSFPTKKEISKIGKQKKRVVYTFKHDENLILKLLTHLLIREYDYLFSPNLYSFRANSGVKKAIKKITSTPHIEDYYSYKIDISNYFNSIDIDKLLSILEEVFAHDKELYAFTQMLLKNPYVKVGKQIIMEKKGVMAGTPNVAVFDTAFHQTISKEAYMYALPYEYYEKYGIRRYGFHGTSHKYVAKRTAELVGKKEFKMVNCHLGNGSSMSAVKDGKCQDTTMGLTPLAGVPMGTRSGDIDAAVVQFICNKYGMSVDECLNMLNKKSGMLAMSGVSSDFRDLEDGAKNGNEDCALARDKFCYEVAKYVGAYAAALNGIDVLTFTAGVGENDCAVRAAVCEYLGFLGVKIDPELNGKRGKEMCISTPDSAVQVWVVPTNEELMIAQDTAELVSAAK